MDEHQQLQYGLEYEHKGRIAAVTANTDDHQGASEQRKTTSAVSSYRAYVDLSPGRLITAYGRDHFTQFPKGFRC